MVSSPAPEEAGVDQGRFGHRLAKAKVIQRACSMAVTGASDDLPPLPPMASVNDSATKRNILLTIPNTLCSLHNHPSVDGFSQICHKNQILSNAPANGILLPTINLYEIDHKTLCPSLVPVCALLCSFEPFCSQLPCRRGLCRGKHCHSGRFLLFVPRIPGRDDA